MPHFILEHSANLIEAPISASFLKKLHELLIEIGPFKLNDIKSRIYSLGTYCVADGKENNAFIHLQLAILPGRSPEIKQLVSARLLEFLKFSFQRSLNALSCSLTVEIRELEKETYSKITSGEI